MDFFIIGTILLVIILFVISKYQNARGKFFYIVIILIILFFGISLSYIKANYNIDLTDYEGIKKVGKIYYSWFGSAFNNVGKIAGYAVKQDWSFNNSTNIEVG